MEIRVVWQQPIPLVDGSKQSLIYVPRDPAAIPDRPGVYVFGRRFGDTVSPPRRGAMTSISHADDAGRATLRYSPAGKTAR